MILYKYRECSEYTEAVLAEKQIWLAEASTLNDPCECSIHELPGDWVSTKMLELKKAQIAGSFAAMAGAPRPVRRRMELLFRKGREFERTYRDFRKLWEKHTRVVLSEPDHLFSSLEDELKHFGVFSLSQDSTHPLMWSHYAKQHQGICLGFAVDDLMSSII